MTKVEEQSAVAAAAEAAAGGKKAPAPAKGGAAPAAPPDFESLLPVPSKQVLDAALRCLASLLSPGSNGEHGGSSGAGSVFPPTDWLIAHADMEHLVLLVQHHSPRVQVSNGESPWLHTWPTVCGLGRGPRVSTHVSSSSEKFTIHTRPKQCVQAVSVVFNTSVPPAQDGPAYPSSSTAAPRYLRCPLSLSTCMSAYSTAVHCLHCPTPSSSGHLTLPPPLSLPAAACSDAGQGSVFSPCTA